MSYRHISPRMDMRSSRTLPHLHHRRALRLTPEIFAAGAVVGLGISNFIGALGILLFLGCTAMVIAMRPAVTLRQIMLFSPLLLYSLLAILSTIWSDAPQQTMRASLELFITCAAAIVIARTLPPERFLLVLFTVFLLFLAALMPYVPSAMASQQALIGFMGSKNQVGFVGYVAFAVGIAILVDRGQHGLVRLAALASLPLGLFIAKLAQSGGTTSSIALFMVTFPPLALLGIFRPPLRMAVTIVTLVFLAAAALFVDDIQAAVAAFRGGVLNKDATLTGRTYLWDFGAHVAATRPTWGHGYAAFWRIGNLDAQGLWRWAGVGQGGFNFHNELVETRVALGYVGVGLLVLTCIAVMIPALVRQVARPSVALACLIGLTMVSYVRAYVEEGLAAPFSLITIVWFATALYGFPPASAEPGAGQPKEPREPGFAPRRTGRRGRSMADRLTGVYRSGL